MELDPSWHWLLGSAVEHSIHSLPWRDPRPGAHVVRAALFMLWSNANAGVMCPVSMTYARFRRCATAPPSWPPSGSRG